MDTMTECHPALALRRCPFCGAEGFEWDGTKAHRCPACSRRLYTNSAAAVAALIETPDGCLLMVRRRFAPHAGTLDLPGGFVDLDETAEHAVIREVREETGLSVEGLRFWKTFANRYLYGGLVYFTTDLVYFGRVTDFSPLRAADDAAECLLLPKNKIDIAQIGLTSIKNIVQEAYLGRQGAP